MMEVISIDGIKLTVRWVGYSKRDILKENIRAEVNTCEFPTPPRLLKVRKSEPIPHRSIVSSIGSVTNNRAKHLTKILSPLVSHPIIDKHPGFCEAY